jgi:hypothetical protein
MSDIYMIQIIVREDMIEIRGLASKQHCYLYHMHITTVWFIRDMSKENMSYGTAGENRVSLSYSSLTSDLETIRMLRGFQRELYFLSTVHLFYDS